MDRSAIHDRTRLRRPQIERGSEAAISVTVAAPPDATELAPLAGIARYLEVRADLAGEPDAGSLRRASGADSSTRSDAPPGAVAVRVRSLSAAAA
jgi:hypothetical protein